MSVTNNMKQISDLQKVLTLGGIFKDEYACINASVLKDLCPEDGKFWDTLMKDGEPENVYHFLTHEVRFVNYFISDYAKSGKCEDMQKQYKSN